MVEPSQRTVRVDFSEKTPPDMQQNIIDIVRRMPISDDYKQLAEFVKVELSKTNPAELPITSVVVSKRG